MFLFGLAERALGEVIAERAREIVALEGQGAVWAIGVIGGTPNLLDRSAPHGITDDLRRGGWDGEWMGRNLDW